MRQSLFDAQEGTIRRTVAHRVTPAVAAVMAALLVAIAALFIALWALWGVLALTR